MPVINPDTFKHYQQIRGLTNKSIAEAARVTETTVGKIKKRKKLQARIVKEIANVLKISVEEITSPLEPNLNSTDRMLGADDYLSSASIIYNVSESWIVQHAPLFFTLLAEQSLQQRKDKVKKCLADLKSLDNKILMRDKYFDQESASNVYLDVIYREFEAIEQKNLAAPQDESRNQNAHFINFLCELEGTADLQLFDAEEYDTDSKNTLELGANVEDLSYFLGVSMDAGWKLLPDDQDPDQDKARKIIQHNYIVSKIPLRLRTPDRADDLVKWTFQWLDNTCNELLPEHPEKAINDRRSLAKSILKTYTDRISGLKYRGKTDKQIDIADWVIQDHETRVSETTFGNVGSEENSDA